MKILKNVLIAVAVIAVIAAVVLYFLPSHYSISNSIEINKPVDVVYGQVADFSKWGAWDPWKGTDPSSKATVEGSPETSGQKMSWEGEKTGSGSMTLVSVTSKQTLVINVDIVKPYPITQKVFWTFEPIGDKTKVTWTTTGGLAYPMGRLSGLGLSKFIDEPEKQGLDNLKKVCEAIPATPVAPVDSTIKAK